MTGGTREIECHYLYLSAASALSTFLFVFQLDPPPPPTYIMLQIIYLFPLNPGFGSDLIFYFSSFFFLCPEFRGSSLIFLLQIQPMSSPVGNSLVSSLSFSFVFFIFLLFLARFPSLVFRRYLCLFLYSSLDLLFFSLFLSLSLHRTLFSQRSKKDPSHSKFTSL